MYCKYVVTVSIYFDESLLTKCMYVCMYVQYICMRLCVHYYIPYGCNLVMLWLHRIDVFGSRCMKAAGSFVTSLAR